MRYCIDSRVAVGHCVRLLPACVAKEKDGIPNCQRIVERSPRRSINRIIARLCYL